MTQIPQNANAALKVLRFDDERPRFVEDTWSLIKRRRTVEKKVNCLILGTSTASIDVVILNSWWPEFDFSGFSVP